MKNKIKYILYKVKNKNIFSKMTEEKKQNTQVGKRVVKYCLIGLMVAFACLVVPQKKALRPEDILAIALVSASSFAILDLLAPNNDCGCDCN